MFPSFSSNFQENWTIFQGYLSLEGLANRITPFSFNSAIPNPDLLYENLMNNFSFGGLKDNPDMLLDENVHRQFSTLVNVYSMAMIISFRLYVEHWHVDVVPVGDGAGVVPDAELLVPVAAVLALDVV